MATPDWAGLIGYRTHAQLMEWAEARWRELDGSITSFNVGGVFRTVVEMAVEVVSALEDRLLAVVPNGFLQWASGPWLVAKVAEVGVTPQVARKARVSLVVSRSGTSGNVVIPIHTRYRTRTNAAGAVLVFDQEAQVVLPDGASSVQVVVEAMAVGTAYNVAPGAICEFVTSVPGVTSVTNLPDALLTEGLDDEHPEYTRLRAQLRWPSLSRGVVKEAYEAFAREVPGVVDVDVDDQHPRGDGTVDVIIVGVAGAPSDELLLAVDASIRSRIPQCVNLLVKGPVLRPTSVSIRVTIPTDRGDAAVTEAAVRARVESLLATGALADVPRLPVSRGLRRGRLVDLAYDVSPVFDAEISAPAESVSAGVGELVVLDGPVVVEVVRGNP